MPKFVLNLIKCLVMLLVCPILQADEVELTNAGADEPIIFVDAEFANCENDKLFSGPPPKISIGQAEAIDTCGDTEIVVFSDDNAVEVVLNPDLTSDPNDTIPVALKPRWQVPLKFWVISPPISLPDKTTLQTSLQLQAIEADLNFNESHAGVSFPSSSFEWIEDSGIAANFAAKAEALLAGEIGNSEFLQFLTQAATPAPSGTITIYAIPSLLITGFHLRNHDRTSSGVIALGSRSTISTLSHELGHAFSLGHVNYYGDEPLKELTGEYCVAFGEHERYDGECDYNTDNLMWAGIESERNSLTEAQALRVTINSNSYLNDPANGIRPDTEVTRDCPDWWFDQACPYLAIDP